MSDFENYDFFDRFELTFVRKKKQEFEDWFVDMAKRAYGSDFDEVRPHGRQGDWKCDGRLNTTNTIFQCYAPEKFDLLNFSNKIQTDFEGAKENWSNWIKKWVFVHNQGKLPPMIYQMIDKLKSENELIEIDLWSRHELRDLAKLLNLTDLEEIFGKRFTREDMLSIQIPDLAPIIDRLEQLEPDAEDTDIIIPSVEKLEKNQLSKYVKESMKMGRLKSPLVKKFFKGDARYEQGEKIAESFRNKYNSLKGLGLEPDSIYHHLQNFAGFHGEPKHQAAVIAVLVYLFDSCDIFEDSKSLE